MGILNPHLQIRSGSNQILNIGSGSEQNTQFRVRNPGLNISVIIYFPSMSIHLTFSTLKVKPAYKILGTACVLKPAIILITITSFLHKKN